MASGSSNDDRGAGGTDVPRDNAGTERAWRAPGTTGQVIVLPAGISMEEAQLELVRLTLRHCHGDKVATAKALGICLKSVYNYLARLRQHPVPYAGRLEVEGVERDEGEPARRRPVTDSDCPSH